MFPNEDGKHKVSLDSVGYDGDMAIHVLARQGNVEDILAIIKAGANPNIKNSFGETARQLAKKIGGQVSSLVS